MDHHELTARLLALCEAADRLRLPGHRHTAEHAFAAHDDLRAGLRGLYRDLTGPRSPPPPSRLDRGKDDRGRRTCRRRPRPA